MTRPPYESRRVSTTGNPLVKLGRARRWLRVLHDEENQLIEELIDASTRFVEDVFRIACRRGQWEATFPGGLADYEMVELPRPPFVTLDAVDEWDADERSWVSRPVAEFVVKASEPVAVIVPAKSEEFSEDDTRIRFTAGYLDTAVPNDLRQAILEVLAWSYEHRGDAAETIEDRAGRTSLARQLRAKFPHLVVMRA